MRKLIYVFAAAALGWGCTAHQADVPMQEIRLSVEGVATGQMATKAVGDALAATAPTGDAVVTLTSPTVSTRVYTFSVGEAVSVPVGKYNVSGGYSGVQVGGMAGNKLYGEPSYSLGGQITVVEGVDSYVVSASYNCAALVFDESVVDKVEHWANGASGFSEGTFWQSVEGYSLVYAKLSYDLDAILHVYPKDETESEMKEYRLCSSERQNGKVFVEPGKWYLFGPANVDKQEGNIGIDLPGWTEGGV